MASDKISADERADYEQKINALIEKHQQENADRVKVAA